MVRRFSLSMVLLGALAPFLLAMGGGGGGPLSDSIPRPKDNFTADLLDRQGVVTRVELFSCAGKTFFPLERGEGTLMVPFAKVRGLAVGAEEGARVAATVDVDGGKPLEGTLPRTLLCTGSTAFGNYQVEIRGLRQIDFAKP